MHTPSPLSDLRVHVKIRLASLWTSLMFCFVYGDYFELYHPRRVRGGMMPSRGGAGAPA